MPVALALARLERREPALAVARERAQLVDLGCARADDRPIRVCARRLVDERRPRSRAAAPAAASSAAATRRGCRVALAQSGRAAPRHAPSAAASARRSRGLGAARRRCVRPGARDRRPGRAPRADVGAQLDVLDEPLDGVQPARRSPPGRRAAPAATSRSRRAHRRGRAVEHLEQRAAPLAPECLERGPGCGASRRRGTSVSCGRTSSGARRCELRRRSPADSEAVESASAPADDASRRAPRSRPTAAPASNRPAPGSGGGRSLRGQPSRHAAALGRDEQLLAPAASSSRGAEPRRPVLGAAVGGAGSASGGASENSVTRTSPSKSTAARPKPSRAARDDREQARRSADRGSPPRGSCPA